MNRIEEQLRATASVVIPGSQTNGAVWEVTFCPDSNFAGFDGHFPDNPVLPAVVQIMMGRLAASMALAAPYQVAGVSRAKFIMPVGPEQTVHVQGGCVEKEDTVVARIQLAVNAEIVSSFTLLLQERV